MNRIQTWKMTSDGLYPPRTSVKPTICSLVNPVHPVQKSFLLRVIVLILFGLPGVTVSAQIQQAWVARYTNGAGQAVKMVLDSAGNIYVAGVSDGGYATIKYAPNGNQVWASRYNSGTPSGLVLDTSNNVIVTGSAVTVKYDTNGNQIWTAPYAGTSLAVDGEGNSIVALSDTTFGTVKLNPMGKALWEQFHSDVGPTVSQAVCVDSSNNVYVAGEDTFYCYNGDCAALHDVELLIIKYDQNGNQLWATVNEDTSASYSLQICGSAVDCSNNFYLSANCCCNFGPAAFKYNPAGALVWTAYWQAGSTNLIRMSLDRQDSVLLTGQLISWTDVYGPNSYYFTTVKMNSIGSPVWTNNYAQQ
jgi:hypothetical protein